MNVISRLPYDALLTFGPAAAVTASADATNILDSKQNTKIARKTLVIDVAVMDRANSDETLSVVLNYSNNADLSAPVVKTTYIIPVATEPTGRFTVEVDNEINGVYYRYSRVSYVLAGTTPSFTGECYYSVKSTI